MSQGIRQLEEKNVPNEIDIMVWSSRMDLVAFSNAKGEVALHRLSWTRAWILCAPKEGLTVKGIAWRPDGKILAIAYSDGRVHLVDLETKAILTKFEVSGMISCISWVQEKTTLKPKDRYNLPEDVKGIEKFIDLAKPYITNPPPISHLEGSINFEDIKDTSSFLQNQAEFNLLVVGTKEGAVHVRIFGCWKCLVLNVAEKLCYKCSIENLQFSEDLSKLFVTVTNDDNSVFTVLFDTDLFRAHSSELYHVSMIYVKFYELILYLEKILANITETWESILLEVDRKLEKYASQVPEGGVTADFLDLLMFGVCTERMEEFLMYDLTKKGLEKFGQTMELSYSNIQSYLFKHIIKFSQNGTLHLSELKGMASFVERFGVIGLDRNQIQKAIQSNGAFVIKASEMQQIINHSVLTYKAFFRWLYSAIMQLMEEPVPVDFQKMTQRDLNCITEFIQNFDNYGQGGNKGTGHKFIMERLGQYLMDEDLTIQPDMSGNDWSQFIEENECLANHPSLLTHYINKSLIQVFNELKSNVDVVFETPSVCIEQTVTPIKSFSFNAAKVIRSINGSSDIVYLATLNPSKTITLYEMSTNNGTYRFCNLHFNLSTDEPFDVVDIQFYSPKVLSVLLQEATDQRRGGIFQLSLQAASDHFDDEDTVAVNAWQLSQKHYKSVDMAVSAFTVSGTRKVSIVLAENKRKVKLFEMECDEDEEDDADMSSFIKDDTL